MLKLNKLAVMLVFFISVLMFTLVTYSQQRVIKKVRKMSLSKPMIKPLPPKLRVEEFGGEFGKWVTFMNVESKRTFRFRWSSAQAGVSFATADIRRGNPYGAVVYQKKLDSIPNPGKISVFNMNPFINTGSGPVTVYVSIRLWKAPNQSIGLLSNRVKIVLKKPSSQITLFKLDRLKLLTVTPRQGLHITGPPASDKSMNNSNSLKLTYFYELNTETSAEIRQWLILQNGSVAPHNHWTYEIVQKGKGQATNRATIFCNTSGQAITRIYGVKYIMTYKGKTLVEKKKMFVRPFFFHCPQSSN